MTAPELLMRWTAHRIIEVLLYNSMMCKCYNMSLSTTYFSAHAVAAIYCLYIIIIIMHAHNP